MNDQNKFSLEVSSDLDYEKMVVNINFGLEQIATLSCDEGIENTKIVLLNCQSENIVWAFPYNEFLDILQSAYVKLKQINIIE
jgi:hypothetical protein